MEAQVSKIWFYPLSCNSSQWTALSHIHTRSVGFNTNRFFSRAAQALLRLILRTARTQILLTKLSSQEGL